MTTTLLRPEDAGPPGIGLRLRVPAALLDDAASIHEGRLAPGDTVPIHVHEATDQLLYIVTGRLRVTVGDETVDATNGDFVVKPRGVAHGFTNVGDDEAVVLEVSTSTAFEQLVAAAADTDDAERIAELQRRSGIRFDA